MYTPSVEDIERFWPKVNFTPKCWEWSAATSPQGYGVFHYGPLHAVTRAHRFVWWTIHGWVEPRVFILHHCDNPLCVRPSHLFPGSNSDNIADRMRKHRQGGGRRKLTPKDVHEILLRIKAGEAQARIAEDYNVGQSNISAIAVGRTWPHLPRP